MLKQVPTSPSAASAQADAIAYRPEIDGLRGLAVLVVVCFHAGLPVLRGGFVGVDVFFVISGYLITSIIQRDARAGEFSFRHFYQRRFRRIAPALVTVTAAAMIAGYVLLLPYELVEFAWSAIAAVTMASNFYFWRTADYFTFAHGIMPLLHSWSLGVEEQFYLLFPAVLVMAERWGRPRLVVGVLGVSSLILCAAVTPAMPAAAFYLLPTRGWELMIGAALAQGTLAVPARAQPTAAYLGLGLIVGSCVLLTAADPYPGWRALLPAIGTALMIGSGMRSTAARALAWAPCVYVGRISYSLYLWHWPILVFLRHWRADVTLSAGWSLAGIALALVLSAASYRWIEQPARRRSTPFRLVLAPSLMVAAAILCASALALATRGLPQRLPRRVVEIAAGHDAYAPLAHSCTSIGFDRARKQCSFGPAGDAEVLLWGDSHAAAISEGVAIGTGRPAVVISMGACPPVLDWPDGEDRVACPQTNARALLLAERDPHIRTVVLSADWLSLSHHKGQSFWRSQQRVVDRLNAAGKNVLVVAGVPDPGVDVPWTSALSERFGRPRLRLRCAAPSIPLRGVTLVDVSTGFCAQPAQKLFSDDNHPSRYAGLAVIAPAISAAMQPAR